MACGDSRLDVARPVPPGREARLWRVLVELAVQVDEAIAAHAEAHAAAAAACEAAEPAASSAPRAATSPTAPVSPAEAPPSSPPRVRAKPRPIVPGRLENLVVEFDDAYTVFVEGMTRLPTEAQMLALQAVDRQLEAMIRARDAALWTEQALREDLRWSEAQRLAGAVIEAFEWPARRLALVG